MSRLPLDRALASDIAVMHRGPTGRAIAGDTLTITGYAIVKKGGGHAWGRGPAGGHGQRRPRQRTFFCQPRRSAAARGSSPGPHAVAAQCVP